MTPETRHSITQAVFVHGADRVSDWTDQEIMGAYLGPFHSDEDYRVRAERRPEFLAVLATEEYHRHWSKR